MKSWYKQQGQTWLLPNAILEPRNVRRSNFWQLLPTETQLSMCIYAVWSVFIVRMKTHCLICYQKMRTIKILIRLHECKGWSESSLFEGKLLTLRLFVSDQPAICMSRRVISCRKENTNNVRDKEVYPKPLICFKWGKGYLARASNCRVNATKCSATDHTNQPTTHLKIANDKLRLMKGKVTVSVVLISLWWIFGKPILKTTRCTLKIFDHLQVWQLLWLPFGFTAHQDSSRKGSTLKGKNLLPSGANSYLLE